MVSSKADLPRQFADQSTRRLFERGDNLRDLMNLVAQKLVTCLDFKRIQLQRRTFVTDAFRDRESDLVFTIPFVDASRKTRRQREILLYILLEHQSEPLADILDRVLEYILEIRRFHHRTQQARRRSHQPLRSPIIVPLVFYTGTRRWDALIDPSEWEDLPDVLRPFALPLRPLFINLSTTPQEHINAQAGWLAPVLRLMQQRNSKRKDFEEQLRAATKSCEQLHATDPSRSREFLWYIEGLIRYVRRAADVEPLRRIVLNTVSHEILRGEISEMWVTEAELLLLDNSKKHLRMLLEEKFGDVPEATLSVIESTKNLDKLEQWLRQLIKAERLDQVGIKKGK